MLSLAACTLTGSDAQLEKLRTEVARLDGVEGLHLVEEDAVDQAETLGKPRRAELTRMYAVDDATPADEVAGALVDRAATAGWSMQPQPQPVLAGAVWRGTKALDGAEATITVTLFTDPEYAPTGTPAPAVRLQLVHPYRST
jgi:hypothetical protein